MKNFKHIVDIASMLNQVLWAVIGIFVLVGIVMAIKIGPHNLTSAFATDFFKVANGAQAKSQSAPPQITAEQTKCLEEELGKERYAVLNVGTEKPTAEEMASIQKCFAAPTK